MERVTTSFAQVFTAVESMAIGATEGVLRVNRKLVET